jgi:diadenosine tetraphosphate (Ap4A) HIT family hydrolase
MATLFEGMWHGDIPSLPFLRSEERGIMAILANLQETPGQVVIFPRRAVERYEDLDWRELDHMSVAATRLIRHMKPRLPAVDRIV